MTSVSTVRREPIRLQKFLSRAGIASRREGERLISAGRVSVDGATVTELGTRVVPGEQVVCVDGRPVHLRRSRWVALYKPVGYLTTRKDERGRPTVYSLLGKRDEDLFHVGRLDRETEGLLILTNDGEPAHRLLHPRFQIPRRYLVVVAGVAGGCEARRLEEGIELDDGRARAEDVNVSQLADERGEPLSEIRLTLREGRKREVRRLMEALGLPLVRLVRLSFGPVELGGLRPGAWRELSPAEIEALRTAVGLGESDGDT